MRKGIGLTFSFNLYRPTLDVKESCYPILNPAQKRKNINKSKNIFERKPKNNSSEKRIPENLENDQKIIEKVQKYKD